MNARLIIALIGSQIQDMTEQAELPADVDEVLAQVAWQPGEHVLDGRPRQDSAPSGGGSGAPQSVGGVRSRMSLLQP